MHIGLIGGIGPAATDYYYRRLIKAFEKTPEALELTIAHAASPILLRNLADGNAAAQAAIFERLSRRLQAAGAEAVAVTAIAGHFCIEEFKALSPLPVLDLLSSVAAFLERNRTYEVLGMFVLLIVGVLLVSEGGHLAHLKLAGAPVEPMAKSTFYLVLGVIVVVEIVQGRYQKKILAAKHAEIEAGAASLPVGR